MQKLNAATNKENIAAAGALAITADRLTRQFGNFTAVDSISFQVAKGEVFGFLGANGAGKTTAIRMLCGLLRPSSGNATVAGYNVSTETTGLKKSIGYMSQRFSLYNDLTINENIRFYGGIYGLTDKQIVARTEALLEQLRMPVQADTLTGRLPVGWKQKLAFMVALIHQPSVVFLDEPTGGVDPITRRQFWELIYETAHKGVTIFVTTHYMDEAEYCHRASIMVAGKIVALDSPAGLKRTFNAGSIQEVFLKLAR